MTNAANKGYEEFPVVQKQTSCSDTKSHYTAIILGAGLSGLAADIQLKRKLGLTDTIVYEKSQDIGGTWNYNRYPGAACDIPFSLYSYSFAPPNDVPQQWAEQHIILKYLHGVQEKFAVKNIAFEHAVQDCSYSRETGLWTVRVKDLNSDEVKTRTCNFLITAVGGLSIPNDPPFPTDKYDGKLFHSARWDHSVDLTNKDVVIVGNGCSAAQIVPQLAPKVKSLTQVARSRQAILRRPVAPNNTFVHFLRKWVPGFGWFLRACVFFIMESMFKTTDIKAGAKERKRVVADTEKYIEERAPRKYWDLLKPDFELAAKRRIFDDGYYDALNNPAVELLMPDAVTAVEGEYAITKSGRKLHADVVVMATGFRVHDYLFPIVIKNESTGEILLDRLKSNNVSMFRGTFVSDFPNLFVLQGPNTATGHSSVIFTSECQIDMMISVIKPIVKKIQSGKRISTPAPTVAVSEKAETEFMQALRKEMKKKVWEKDGGVSWYVDKKTGLCTTLFPWSQVAFWWGATWGLRPKRDFVYKNL